VLLLAVVSILSISAYIYGNAEITKLEDVPLASNAESMMASVDAAIQTVAHGDTNFTTTMDLFYPKGLVKVDEGNNWIQFSGQINTNAYAPVTGTPDNNLSTRCNKTTAIIQDSETTVKMGRVLYTNVYRGALGTDSQFVEIVSCDNSIEISADPTCRGKSGPRSRMTVRKTGYNQTTSKPMVQVRVC
jgi:hypothetical protein